MKNFLLGCITDIRWFHQFYPSSNSTIVCQRTSNSLDSERFALRCNEEAIQPSLQPVTTLQDIVISQSVIINHENKLYRAQVSAIDQAQAKVEVECYILPFPHSSNLVSYTKLRSKLIIEWLNAVAVLVDQPASDQQKQRLLSKEQFRDIKSLCR